MKTDDKVKKVASKKRVGFIAEDFNGLFLGNSSKKEIYEGDVQTAMVQAIQALIVENEELKARVEALEKAK